MPTPTPSDPSPDPYTPVSDLETPALRVDLEVMADYLSYQTVGDRTGDRVVHLAEALEAFATDSSRKSGTSRPGGKSGDRLLPPNGDPTGDAGTTGPYLIRATTLSDA